MYALSFPSRTTFLLVSKESDGRIANKSREKENYLSLKKSNLKLLGFFFLSSAPHFLFLCFIPSFLFFFLFLFLVSFSHHFFSSFLFLFLFHFSPFSPFSLHFSPPFWSIDRMGQKEEVSTPPSSSQMCGFPFFLPFLLFHNSFYDIIHYMA